MTNFAKTLVAGATALGMAGSASALTVEIDPFDTLFDGENNQVTINTGSISTGPTALANGNVRSVDFEVTSNLSAEQSNSAQLEIAGGQLSLTNGAQVESLVTLSYDVNDLLSSAATITGDDIATLDILTVAADLTRILTLSVNGVETDSVTVSTQVGQTLGGEPIGIQMLTTSLSFDTSLLTGDDTIALSVTGPSDLDYTVSILSANFDDPIEVPAPAVLGLFGLGLAGIGAMRRRKAA